MNDSPVPTTGPRRLTRAADDSMLAGVCGGLARYADVDATLVRVVTVVLLVLGVFPVVVAYLLLWVLMPRQ